MPGKIDENIDTENLGDEIKRAIETRSQTKSYDEPSDEEIARDEIIAEVRTLLSDENPGKAVVEKLKVLMQKADSETREEIDALIISQLPDATDVEDPSIKTFACVFDELASSKINTCKPLCIRGHQLSTSPSCDSMVYEMRKSKLKKIADKNSPNVHVYVCPDSKISKKEITKIFDSNPQAIKITVYQQDTKSFRFEKLGVFRRTTNAPPAANDRGAAAAVILVFVLFVLVVIIALALRYSLN